MLIGYGRVSTRGQKLDRQEDALTSAGCTRIFMEKLSGKNADRPELVKCLDFARAGDTITVRELWRLGRTCRTCCRSSATCVAAGTGSNPSTKTSTPPRRAAD
jgi:DNA invertase Pin-like site-specific DNA recombinase